MHMDKLLPSPENRWLCFYHGACFDGMAAAWLIKKRAGAQPVKFAPLTYTDSPRFDAETLAQVETVTFVDFSPSEQMVQQLRALHKKVVVIDHHAATEGLMTLEDEGITIFYDPHKSGTSLAWHLCFPDEKVPDFIRLMEEIDLSLIPPQLAQQAYFEAAAFINLHRADDTLEHADPWLTEALHLPRAALALRGAAHRAALLARIQSAIKNPEYIWFEGLRIPLVQADIYPLGHEFFSAFMQQENSETAAAWHICPGYVRLNLRAKRHKSVVALRDYLIKKYGAAGGGHAHASIVRLSMAAFKRFYEESVEAIR